MACLPIMACLRDSTSLRVAIDSSPSPQVIVVMRPGEIPDGTANMTQGYLRTSAAAKYLGCGQSTLERKRIDGTGPRFRKLGTRMITYAVEDLDAWASEQILNSTSELQAA